MFYGQCNACGERWGLGTASTCKCPQPDRWVGLTDEEIAAVMHGSVEGERMLPYQFARAIEAKLKERNT